MNQLNISTSPLKAESILELLMGVERAGLLRAALQLKLFDQLSAKPVSAQVVADKIGATGRAIRIVLDGLTSLKLLAKRDEGYVLTDGAERYLVSTAPAYIGELRHVYTADIMWQAFLNLDSAIMTGKSALPHSLETENHPYWQEFAQGVARSSQAAIKRWIPILEPWIKQQSTLPILDIACGNGLYGCQFASLHPDSTLTLLDWPNVLDLTQQRLVNEPIFARTQFLAGNMLSVDIAKNSYKLVILSQVLHHFDQATCLQILRRAYDALQPGGRLLISGFIKVHDAPESAPVEHLFAVQMLALTQQGELYSTQQYRQMLQEVGFQPPTIYPFDGLPIHGIIAEK